jgi:hypothetical protein
MTRIEDAWFEMHRPAQVWHPSGGPFADVT